MIRRQQRDCFMTGWRAVQEILDQRIYDPAMRSGGVRIRGGIAERRSTVELRLHDASGWTAPEFTLQLLLLSQSAVEGTDSLMEIAIGLDELVSHMDILG